MNNCFKIIFVLFFYLVFVKKVFAVSCCPSYIICEELATTTECSRTHIYCSIDSNCELDETCETVLDPEMYNWNCNTGDGDCLTSCEPGQAQYGSCGGVCSAPPPPGCGGVCCAESTCAGPYSEDDGGACNDQVPGTSCCTACISYGTPDPPPDPPVRPGGFKIWYFWDKDGSGDWTLGDDLVPSSVLEQTKIEVDIGHENLHYEYMGDSDINNGGWKWINIIDGATYWTLDNTK